MLGTDLTALEPGCGVVVGEEPEIRRLGGAAADASASVLEPQVVANLTAGRVAHHLLDGERRTGCRLGERCCLRGRVQRVDPFRGKEFGHGQGCYGAPRQ